MFVDILIIIFAISALYRGREIGFVRQLLSTIGFFGGLFLGAWLQPHIISLVEGQTLRLLVTLVTTLGCALLFFALGDYIGLRLKDKFKLKRADHFDNGFGGVLSIVTLLLAIWLTAAIINSLPMPELKATVDKSRIVRSLNRNLPDAPDVLSRLGHLINPNGFPQVFINGEPTPQQPVDLPSLGELQDAVDQTRASVVKIEGRGCGGVVDGSGFVVGSNLVATNAHVVAGLRNPYVQDSNGTHSAVVIWFDPDLDFAVLRVSNLAGKPLVLADGTVKAGTPAAALGYPGGGGFTGTPAVVRDRFIASGRDIYGRGSTNRDVYELQASIRQGNSGGPLVAKDGTVIGVIFAQSTTHQNVGYALTADQAERSIDQAIARNRPVGTGQCAK